MTAPVRELKTPSVIATLSCVLKPNGALPMLNEWASCA